MFGWFAAREVVVLDIHATALDITGVGGARLAIVTSFLAPAAYPVGAFVTLRARVGIIADRRIGDRYVGDNLDVALDLTLGRHAPGDLRGKPVTGLFGFWLTAGNFLVLDMGAASIGVAGVIGTFVLVITVNRGSSLTGTVLADFNTVAGIPITAGLGLTRLAGTIAALVSLRTSVAIITRGGVRSELACLSSLIAGIIGAEVAIVKGWCGTTHTLVVLTGLSAIAEGAIVAVGIFEATACYFGLSGADP